MGYIAGPGGGASPVSTFTTAANGAAIAVGETFIIAKLVQTQFSSTTPALDPDFQVQNVPAGMYAWQGFFVFQGGAGGTRIGISPAGMYGLGVASCGGGAVGGVLLQLNGGALCSGANEFRVTANGGSPVAFAGGTIGLQVRINDPAFEGTASFFLARSWFSLTRVN